MTEMTRPPPMAMGPIAPELWARFEERLRTSGLTADKIQEVIHANCSAIVEGMFAALYRHVEESLVFVNPRRHEVTISQRRNPAEYYCDRKGLSFSGGMRELAARSKPTEAGVKFDLTVGSLGIYATDRLIETALPSNHLFDASVLCAVIPEMIEAQPDGIPGELMSDGHANLFYTTSWPVCVSWCAARRWHWLVDTWHPGEGEWREGSKVFAPCDPSL